MFDVEAEKLAELYALQSEPYRNDTASFEDAICSNQKIKVSNRQDG